MKKGFRVISILLTLVMLLGANSVFAIENSSQTFRVSTLTEVERFVVDKFISEAEVEINEDDIVTITSDYISIKKDLNDGNSETTYIIGSSVEDGELKTVNPKQLVKELSTRSSVTYNAYYKKNSKVALTLTYTASYSKYYNSNTDWYCYRPYMITAKWSPSSYFPSLTVSNMRVGYGSEGKLVSYPSCTTTSNMSNVVVQSDYVHYIEINKANPAASTNQAKYLTLNNSYALWFANYFYYGSYVDWDITTNYGTFTASVELGNSY